MHGHVEASVQTNEAVALEHLHQAVTQTVELALSAALADIGGQTSSGKVKWVHEAQRGSTSRATGGQVASKVTPELGLLVNAAQEHLLELVLEGKVKRLGGEVSDNVGQVASPEGQHALFLGNSDKGIDDTCGHKSES